MAAFNWYLPQSPKTLGPTSPHHRHRCSCCPVGGSHQPLVFLTTTHLSTRTRFAKASTHVPGASSCCCEGRLPFSLWTCSLSSPRSLLKLLSASFHCCPAAHPRGGWHLQRKQSHSTDEPKIHLLGRRKCPLKMRCTGPSSVQMSSAAETSTNNIRRQTVRNGAK